MTNRIDKTEHPDLFTTGVCAFYFALSFFEPYLSGVIGSVTKYYIFFLIGVLIFRSQKKIILLKPYSVSVVLWLILKMISLVWTNNYYIAQTHLISQVGMVLLLIGLTSKTYDIRFVDVMVKTMWFSSGLIGLLSLFFNQPYLGRVVTRRVLVLFSQEIDPNNQAAFVLIGCAISLYYFIVLKKQRILSGIILAVNAMSLFLTGSRGGFISLVALLLVIVISGGKGNSLLSRIYILVAISIVSLLLYIMVERYLPTNIFGRLFGLSTYEGGSDRDVIWSNGWDLYTDNINFLFGAGWGSYWGYNNQYVVMHNTYLSMLCDVGSVGFLLFFSPLIKACFKLFKARHLLPILILLSACVPSFFIESINKRFFWNAIFIVYMYFNTIFVKKTNQHQITI